MLFCRANLHSSPTTCPAYVSANESPDVSWLDGCLLPAEMTEISQYDYQRTMWVWISSESVPRLLHGLIIKNQKGKLHIMLCYGSCSRLQFLPTRSCSLSSGSKPGVFGCAEILLQARVFLLMEDLLLLARWKRSSNKCGPIYHLQHITGELGVIIHAGRGMNRPFKGSWAQTLKRASPSSFSTG